MTVGFDADGSKLAYCGAKTWVDSIQAAYVITAEGTLMDSNTVCDGIEVAAEFADAVIKNTLDAAAGSAGATDTVYAETVLIDCCKTIHNRVLELSDFSGQGIYLSGVIAYCIDKAFIAIPFGGGSLYRHDGEHLEVLSAPESKIIRNAIGGTRVWHGKCLRGEVAQEGRLLLTSNAADPVRCDQIIRVNGTERSHRNTASMLIRRDLEKAYPGSATAVLDMKF